MRLREPEEATRDGGSESGHLALAERARAFTIDVVILARNEAGVLGATLANIQHALGESGTIHVVADRCVDETAQQASRLGATVWVRTQAHPAGKGGALGHWLDRTARGASPDQVILVLDADSSIDADFVRVVGALLSTGARAIQLPVNPTLPRQGVVPRLAAFSEYVEHEIFERSRARLGWPVRLRGTGMVFRRSLLAEVGKDLRTVVEDLELTLRVLGLGEPIAYAEGTYVLDPKPEDASGVVRQRSRWLVGQLDVLRSYRWQILRVAMTGPAGWSVLSSMFVRPKALVLPGLATLCALFGALAWRTSNPTWAVATAVAALPLGVEMLACSLGLLRASDRRELIRALLLWPAYGLAWIGSIALAMTSHEAWQRVRPSHPMPPATEPRHAPESPWVS